MNTDSATVRSRLDLSQSPNVINFYSTPAQRNRGIEWLHTGRPSVGIVLATRREDVGYYSAAMKAARIDIVRVNLVEVTPDWRRAISHMLDGALHSQHESRSVQLLADFAGNVHLGSIYELESLLRSATAEWKVRCCTQYDARQFSEPVDMESLSQFGTVLVGDYFHDRSMQHRDIGIPDNDSDRRTA